MPNNEVIHFGKTLGFISKEQADLVEKNATKLTKGSEKIVSLNDSERNVA